MNSAWCESAQKIASEAVDTAVPTLLVLVARVGVGELLMRHDELRPVARGLEFDGDQRLAIRRAFPGPGVDELFVGHDFPIRAADFVQLAAGRVHYDTVTAADTKFGGDFRLAEIVARPHPVLYLLGVRPRGVDFGDGNVVDTSDLETGLFVDCCFHVSISFFSRNAPNRSSCVFQNSSWRSSHTMAPFRAPPLS